MRRQDVGLQTHLDQLDRQISALQLDVRRGPGETADSDSRPSSGTPAGEPTAARAPGSARITEGSECFQCLYLSAIGKKGGFPKGAGGKEPACQCRRHKRRGFDPWAGKIPWRRARQPLPVFLPGESHGQRSLVGHSPWGRTESDAPERSQEKRRECCVRCLVGKFSLAALGGRNCVSYSPLSGPRHVLGCVWVEPMWELQIAAFVW